MRLARLTVSHAAMVFALAHSAFACPCSDDGGALGLTRPGERAAFGLVATTRGTHGRYDALGRYSALGAGESEWSQELLARLALRLPARVEWLTELGFASYHFEGPGVREERAGIGDALLRARTLLFEESMPHQSWRPSLGVSAIARAPLGSLAQSGSAGYGSGGVQLGLGAWEAGVGGDIAKSVTPRLTLALALEGAYRFPDRALDRARRLGPRADASLSAAFAFADWFSTVASARARVIGDVTLDQRRLPGTGERLITLAASALWAPRQSRWRSTVTVAIEPPLSRLAEGAAGTTALSFGLTYVID